MRMTSLGLGLTCLVLASTNLPAAADEPSGPVEAAPVTVLDYRFDGGANNATITSPVNSGTLGSVTATVLTRGTAVPGPPPIKPKAVFRAGPAGSDTAMRLPAWVDAATDPPLAIVAVTNPASVTDPAADPMNPKTANFSWRADFKIDANTGSDPADGDNVFQRGLSPNVLWKLQADRGAVSCTIRAANTTSGAITQSQTDPIRVDPNKWVRAICARTGSTLSLTLQKLVRGAWTPFATATAATPVTGTLAMPTDVPVSIGGKLKSGTAIATPAQSPSMFNGSIDNAVLNIGS